VGRGGWGLTVSGLIHALDAVGVSTSNVRTADGRSVLGYDRSELIRAMGGLRREAKVSRPSASSEDDIQLHGRILRALIDEARVDGFKDGLKKISHERALRAVNDTRLGLGSYSSDGLADILRACGVEEQGPIGVEGHGSYSIHDLKDALAESVGRGLFAEAAGQIVARRLLEALLEMAGPQDEAILRDEALDYLCQQELVGDTSLHRTDAQQTLARYVPTTHVSRGGSHHPGYALSDVREALERGTELPVKVSSPEPAETPSRSLERVTLNLSAKTQEALTSGVALTGDTKTDVINKGVQVYERLLRSIEDGAVLYIRETPDGELERVRFF
jgi:hypothetical protein